uniref:KIB1-4 beta-propeller domain-containing protein n=1 Tax=Oryza punctata TaxID=4537 RepID=A0A0E0L6Z6_ORYPU
MDGSCRGRPPQTELSALGHREVAAAESAYIFHLVRNLSLRCSALPNAPNRMRYLGCSYGYLILSYHEKNCLFVDVYTGTKLKSPKLHFIGDREIYYGILTAPLNSPNSHLLLCSRSSIFYWQVGTNSWTKHVYGGECILQIVLFKGEIFAMDFLGRLHIVRFAPQFSIQEVAVMRREEMVTGPRCRPWLVVCGEMLLMVDSSTDSDQLPCTFQVFRLEFSAETVECVKMEKLENQALFVSLDRRDPTFSCMSTERWGGKSNWIYVAKPSGDSGEPWTAVELGQPVPSITGCVPDVQVENMYPV